MVIRAIMYMCTLYVYTIPHSLIPLPLSLSTLQSIYLQKAKRYLGIFIYNLLLVKHIKREKEDKVSAMLMHVSIIVICAVERDEERVPRS